ncbi:MAG: DUF2975 domain-containing protein [Firmicutes bacterium]|nr:DUF2975 domain-containing protein [Bacillota bacterium]
MNKAVIIISKILEVAHWIGCGFMIVITIALAAGKDGIVSNLSDISMSAEELEMYGFTVGSENGGPLPAGGFILFGIAGIIILALMAMVFRNIYLIFKTALGQTKFSEGETPFQPAIIRMTREIGYFCIAIPVVQLILCIIAAIVSGAGTGTGIEASVQFSTLFFGLIILCLSRFFSYGLQLQKDTEGLV